MDDMEGMERSMEAAGRDDDLLPFMMVGRRVSNPATEWVDPAGRVSSSGMDSGSMVAAD
jgi:hypothetical protein